MIANINIKGQKYTGINITKYSDESIYIKSKEVAKMVRQFIKSNYPKLKSWVRTEKYSCGSSISVSLKKEDYDKYREVLYTELRERFRSRYYDGMRDQWEEEEVVTDLGTKVSFSCDGISVYQKY